MTDLPQTIEPYDFRKPRRLAGSSRRTLHHWLEDGCTLVAERWQRLNLDVKLSLGVTQTLSLDSALEAFADPGWGMRVGIGVSSFTTVIAGGPVWLRMLVNRLLGETEPPEAKDTSLTAIEQSMAELLLQEMMTALGDAWPGAEPVDIKLHEVIPRPRRTRVFVPRTTLSVITFRMESGEGKGELIWAIPQIKIEDLIDIECSPPVTPQVKPSPDMPRLVRSMSVPLTVELGHMTLSMTELSSLQAGDVVVLDRSSALPLAARIGNAVKFHGRPGRLGNRRCLEIEQVLESDESATSNISRGSK